MKSPLRLVAFFPALASANPSFEFNYTEIEVSALRFCDAKADDFKLPDLAPPLVLFRQAMPRHIKAPWNMPHVVVGGAIDYKMMMGSPDPAIGYSLIVKEVDTSSVREVLRGK